MDPPPPPPVDLLSSLPEHLQNEILTRLDLRDAVRASAISRAWRRRWETLPGLALSFPDGTPLSAVDGVLRRYEGRGRSITRFAYHVNGPASSHVNDWLATLSRRSVESISIFNRHARYLTVIHSSTFSAHRLVSLTLERCFIQPQPGAAAGRGFAAAGGFPVLKELYLKFVRFEVGQLQDMIRASPMLGVLLLEHVYATGADCVIQAPSLHTLGLTSWSSSIHWRFGELPRLRYACIHGPNYIHGGPAGLKQLLAGVSQVQELTFKLPQCQFETDAIFFTFSNLKSMELSTDFDDMQSISLIFCLLRSTPNLEKLKIEVRWSNSMILNHEFLNEQWTDGMCANLQVVQITSYNGCLPLSFLECILSKASLLRTLSVDACPVSQGDRLNELLNCRRASPQAQVLFKVQLEKISFDCMKFAEKRLN